MVVVNSSAVAVSSSRLAGLPRVRRRDPGPPSASAWMATRGTVPLPTDVDSRTPLKRELTGPVVKACP